MSPTVVQAVCVDGAVTVPTLTTPTTTGILYSTDGDPPYAPDDIVTVTATLDAAGVGWPAALPTGWTQTSDTTATYEVEFLDAECTLATPLGPNVVQPRCERGFVLPSSVSAVATSGVTYSITPAGPYPTDADLEVVVIATLADGFEWGDLPPEWTEIDLVTARTTASLVTTSCEDAALATVTVVQPVCVDGAATEPALDYFTSTPGIVYGFDVPPPWSPGDTVVLTATIDAIGVGWPDELPDGWLEISPTTAEYTVSFDDVSCIPVAPIDPTVVLATCGVGGVVPSSITLTPTAGIVYTTDPLGPYDPFADTMVTVTAALLDGYVWAGGTGPTAFFGEARALRGVALPTGWTLTGPATATFTVDLPALPECPSAVTSTSTDPPPQATSGSSSTSPSQTTAVSGAGGATTSTSTAAGSLPQTGSDGIGSAVGFAALLAGAGVVLIAAARRRTT